MPKEWRKKYLDGKSINLIAQESRTSFGIVYRALKKSGLVFRPRGRPPKVNVKAVCSMYLSGKSLREIAREMNVSHVAIAYNLKKAGIYVQGSNALAKH